MKMLHAFAMTAALIAASTVPSIGLADESFISLENISEASVISSQWVKPAADGIVEGSISVMAAVEPNLSGEVVLAAKNAPALVVPVNSAGRFTLRGVEPGVYTLVYQSSVAFSAFALQVVDASADSSLGNQVTISAALLNPEDALAAVAKYQPPKVTEVYSIGGDILSQGSQVASDKSLYQVYQTSSGGVRGRLVEAGSSEAGLRSADGVNAIVFSNGKEVGRAVSDSDGYFEIDSLAPGNYAFVASGAAGFAVIGFELVAGPEVLTAKSDLGSSVVTTVQGEPATLVMLQIAPPDPNVIGSNPPSNSGNQDEVSASLPINQFAPPTGMGAGFGGAPTGGISGGGGGAGLGGGFGGVGIGGLAAVAALLATGLGDDDGDSFTPAPASPARP